MMPSLTIADVERAAHGDTVATMLRSLRARRTYLLNSNGPNSINVYNKVANWHFDWEKELIYHASHHGKDPKHERRTRDYRGATSDTALWFDRSAEGGLG